MGQSVSRYQRLNVQDAGFLYLEHAGLPQHVAILAVAEGGPLHDQDGHLRLEAVRQQLGRRLHLASRLRQLVVCPPLGQGLPLWVDDPTFDLANHVRAVQVAAPGGEQELLALCDRLGLRLLDRSRPLWELWLVTGLAHGRVGLVLKLHHALADGLAAVQIAGALLLDTTPDVPSRQPPPGNRGRHHQGGRWQSTTCKDAPPRWQRRWPGCATQGGWRRRRACWRGPGAWCRMAGSPGGTPHCAGRSAAVGGWCWPVRA